MTKNRINIGFDLKKHKFLYRCLIVYNVLLLLMFKEGEYIDYYTFPIFVYYINIGIVVVYFAVHYFIKFFSSQFKKRDPKDRGGF